MASIRRRRDRKSGWIVDCRDVPGGRRLTVATREAVEALRAEMVRQGQQAQPPAQDRDVVLDVFADRWLDQIAASLDPQTVISYRQTLSRHIRPVFGQMKLRAIHRSHLKTLLAKKREDGLSKNSVRIIRATLSVMLGDAIEDGILQVNPATGIGRRGRKRPDTISQTERQQNVRVMDYRQLATFLTVSEARCSQREHLLFLLMADSGLRPGEACAVQWKDFDAVGQTLRVERAVTNSGRIKTTKTGSAREVDLSPRVTAALARFQAILEAEAMLAGQTVIDPWVFAPKPGQPFRPQRAGRLFDRVVRAAGLPHFVLYDLRHSYASHLIASGASIDYVSKQLGHASMATTLAFYGHWFPKGDRRHVERLERTRAEALPLKVPMTDDAGLVFAAEGVNDGSWHRFGPTDEVHEMVETELVEFAGAEGGTRTPTPLRAHDPESRAGDEPALSLFASLRVTSVSLSLFGSRRQDSRRQDSHTRTQFSPFDESVQRKSTQGIQGLWTLITTGSYPAVRESPSALLVDHSRGGRGSPRGDADDRL